MSGFSDEDIDLIASRSRALGDPTRVRILTVLAGGEQPVGQIAEAAGTLPSTASKHLQVLFHAGLVHRRRDASTVLYEIASEALLPWLRALGARRSLKAPVRMDPTHARVATKSAQRRRG